ncbi:MAG: DUF4917 family protein [Actinobacteria bacterium]|nr:DUF4917 family protein [Actinomycetota bacterium]
MTDLPDGTLRPWGEVAESCSWETLLIGNGLSRHVWDPFGYPTLFEHASTADLSAADRALFGPGPNFERALGDLLTAIRVCSVVGIDTAPLYARYRSIQTALGSAVRNVHINRDAVPGETRQAIKDAMAEFEWVFTTNYDLLIYWAMAYGGDFTPFLDHFRWGGRCEFDPARAPVEVGQVPIYFLHGALHLVVAGDGTVFKLTRQRITTLLEQFGQPIDGDPDARPLLVTEGSAKDKLEVIEGNEYLAHCLDRLQRNDLDTVVFGSALGDEDAHIAAALSESPGRAVAVSMLPGGAKADRLARQLDIYGRVAVDELIFFDATTHPPGAAKLRVRASEAGS